MMSLHYQGRCCLLVCACLLFASSSVAQAPPEPGLVNPLDEAQQPDSVDASDEQLLLPEEPMTPKEELFLAIELKDVEAARGALKRGADSEIASGDPSPLATAALHNDLRMVALLLEAGGDPNATADSPLEEAVRNENVRMVELFMNSGAQVPAGAAGQELFRLAQRGDAATGLSKILLDHGADADQCLAAATEQARIELMKYCLSRGADAGKLPVTMNALNVAVTSGDTEIIDLLLADASADRLLIGAFTAAVTAGRMDLVQRALAAGAVPTFGQVEAAIESGRPDISLFLLDQSAPDDPSALSGGDVEGLIQRAEDLDFAEVAVALRSKSGMSSWAADTWLPVALVALLVVGLSVLLLSSLSRRRPQASATAAVVGPRAAAGNSAPKSRPAPATTAPVAASEPAVAPAVSSFPAPQPVAVTSAVDPSPAATLPIGAIPTMPSVPQVPAMAGPAAPTPSRSPSGIPALDRPAPVRVDAADAATGGSNVWQVAPLTVAAARSAASTPDHVDATAQQPQRSVEVRMPEVDLARDADSIFEAARRASSGEVVRSDAPDRRQLVLVTPSRVTMLRSCPAPGSLAPGQLAAAERLAGTSPAKNVAAIGYTDPDAMRDNIQSAIPFFDLLRELGYLGHAVWIFEGHVSAMAAGCRDADVLIVDDGMMPYMPGNWRSVAIRVMRGSDIHLFERKTGSLRRLT